LYISAVVDDKNQLDRSAAEQIKLLDELFIIIFKFTYAYNTFIVQTMFCYIILLN